MRSGRDQTEKLMSRRSIKTCCCKKFKRLFTALVFMKLIIFFTVESITKSKLSSFSINSGDSSPVITLECKDIMSLIVIFGYCASSTFLRSAMGK